MRKDTCARQAKLAHTTIGTVHQILVRTGTSAVEGFVITLMTPIIGILMETCH